MNHLLEDLRQAGRTLAATPVVTALAVVTLGLGMGATLAIFTVLHGVVLAPMPYPDADRLVRIQSPVPGLEDGAVWNVSSAQYFYLQEHSDALQTVGVWQVNGRNVRTNEHAGRAVAAIVSHQIPDLIGARALHGRLIDRNDDRPDAAPVVMLSHEYWRQEYGSNVSVIGRNLEIDGQAYEVIGVMAPAIRLPGEAGAPPQMETPDLWITQRLNPTGPFANSHVFMAMGRLAPGANLGSAESELRELTARLPEAFPNVYGDDFVSRFGFQTRPTTLKSVHVGEMAQHLWLLFAAVGLVLLVALANVVNLFLARVEARRHELVIRAALGASLWKLGWHVLLQSMMLAGAGAVLAVFAAFLGVRMLMLHVPDVFPRAESIGLDAIVIGFALIVALTIGVLLAVLVVWRLRRAAVRPVAGDESLRSTASGERQRMRFGLVASQVAIALVLLVAAGMLLQSFSRLQGIDPGFTPDNVFQMQLHLPRERYREHPDVWQFYSELLERVEVLPEVLSAGAGNPLPLSGGYGCWAQGFEDAAVDQRMRERGQTACGDVVVTAPGYFETLDVPVVAGRVFTRADLDHPDTGAVVVSQAFADRFWPDEDPLGKGVRPLAAPGETPRYYRVVGVVGDLPASSLEGASATAVYYPIIPVPGEGFPISPSLHLNLLVKTAGHDLPGLAATIRNLVREQDPSVAVDPMGSMNELVARSTRHTGFSMRLFAIAALIVLFLAAAGLYGVISYLVARRTHETGIRLALGAAGENVQWLVLAGSLKMVGAGLAVGAVASVALARVIHGMFYDIRPADPLIYLLAAAVLAGVAVLASYLPARKAARTEPIEALRHE